MVRVRIAGEGLERVDSLDAPVGNLHRRQLGRMGDRRLRALIDLLEEARGEGS